MFAVVMDLVNDLPLEIVDVLVLQLLQKVAAHNLVPDLVVALVNHQGGVLLVVVSCQSLLLVPVQFLFHGVFNHLLLVVRELAQGPDRP